MITLLPMFPRLVFFRNVIPPNAIKINPFLSECTAYNCTNDVCVSLQDMCNGINDCGNYADEDIEYCSGKSCYNTILLSISLQGVFLSMASSNCKKCPHVYLMVMNAS